MRLQNRILVLFSLLFTVGFLFLMFFSTSAVERTNRKMVDSFSTQSFEFKSQEVGQWLAQRLTELRVIAKNEALKDGSIEGAIPYIARLNENIGTQYGNEWGTFAIGYKDGIGWVSQDRYIDISARSYFHEAMTGQREYVLSDPVISRTDQAEISLICYPLRNEEGEVYGFLNAAISLEKLHQIVSELDFYNGQSWIMDPNGNIYTRSGADETAAETILPRLKTETKGSLDMADGARTVFYTWIPYTENWYLCTSIENSLLMEDTRQLTMELSVVLLTVMALLFLFSVLVARSVTEPIRKLTKAMKEVETGNWEVCLDMKGRDEIASLSRSFDEMVKKMHILVLQTAENEREKRTAELRVLQAQINPHFLYNTLDTLLYKAYDTEDEDMVTMISSLSTFFRISLSKGREIIPLEKELEHVKSYLKIQKIRFQDVLDYDFEVEADGSFQVLKLILQPLVENAIQHGIKPKMTQGTVHIRIVQQEERLVMEVEDDGVGMKEEQLEQLQRELKEGAPGKSYGLINVSNRVRLLYGEGAGVSVESRAGKGTCVKITLTKLQDKKAEGVYG